jgi:alpha-tubulin suppressor-like RCC1 family protein
LNGTNNRTIPSKWKDKNIILEKYNSNPQNITIRGLAVESNDAVELNKVNTVRITSISTGSGHSLALDSDGGLWATGWNPHGQLGLGDKTNRNSFQPVTISGLTSGAKITSISAGGAHSLALDSDGRVWATGNNNYGQLGLNDSQTSFRLATIDGLTVGAKITDVIAGDTYSFAIDDEGKLWATWDNEYGLLGSASFQPVTIAMASSAKVISVSANDDYYIALDNGGRLLASTATGLLNPGSNAIFAYVKDSILAPSDIASIAAGWSYSLVLDSNGKIWATGDNTFGQLGLGNNVSQNSFKVVTIGDLALDAKIDSIAARWFHSFALDSNGKLWATGWNDNGQLGLGINKYQDSFQPLTLGLISSAKIIYIATSSSHSLALDSNGKMWATGSNDNGQLGLGDIIDRNVFTPVPFSF